MNSVERFAKTYNYYLAYEEAEHQFAILGMPFGQTKFWELFYCVFEEINDMILDPEGLDILYNEILFQNISLEDALSMLDGHFL